MLGSYTVLYAVPLRLHTVMLQHESPWPWQGEGPAHPGYPLIVASPITPLQAYPMAMACPASLVAAHWLPSTARTPASQARCRLRADWVVVAIVLIVMAAMAWVCHGRSWHRRHRRGVCVGCPARTLMGHTRLSSSWRRIPSQKSALFQMVEYT